MAGMLKGKVAIVTGASSGFGEAISKSLAREGVKVAMAARREDRLKEVQKSIEETGGVAILVKTDVTDSDQVSALVKETETKLGPVDILVNNAGALFITEMRTINVEQANRQIDVNCKGVTFCVGAVLDGMVRRKSGHIVNMSSDSGRRGMGGFAVYCGTKFYVEGLSKSLREELKGTGVRVTCIQPGNAQTEIFDQSTDTQARQDWDESIKHRIMTVDDVARAVVYAVSQPDYLCVNELLIQPRDEYV